MLVRKPPGPSTPVPGATKASYTPVHADVGKKLTLRITRTLPGYRPFIQVFGPGDYPVLKASWRINTLPALIGTAKVGYTLTASNGSWPSGSTFTYQWYRGTSAISGATAKTYKATAADRGHKLRVRVRGSHPGYHPSTSYSPYSAAVAYGTLKIGTPVIKGTTKVGATVSSSVPGYTSGTTLTRQWYRSGTAIKGAVSSSYKLASRDRGKRIALKIKATRPGYTSVSKTSAATYAIR